MRNQDKSNNKSTINRDPVTRTGTRYESPRDTYVTRTGTRYEPQSQEITRSGFLGTPHEIQIDRPKSISHESDDSIILRPWSITHPVPDTNATRNPSISHEGPSDDVVRPSVPHDSTNTEVKRATSVEHDSPNTKVSRVVDDKSIVSFISTLRPESVEHIPDDTRITRPENVSTTQDFSANRPDPVLHDTSDTSVNRSGTPGTTSDINTERGDSVSHDNPDTSVKRGGTLGTHTDITVDRPGQLGTHPGKSLYDKVQSTLGTIDSLADDILGPNTPNLTNINTWIKKLSGGQGVEVVTGFDANNQDLLAYFKHIMANGSNLVRIPMDLLARLLIIPAERDASVATRVLYTGDGDLQTPGVKQGNKLLQKYLRDDSRPYYKGLRGFEYMVKDAQDQTRIALQDKARGLDESVREYKNKLKESETPYSSYTPNTNIESDAVKGTGELKRVAQYLGYELTDGKVTEIWKSLSNVMNRQGFNQPMTINTFKPKRGSKDEIFFTTRERLSTLEGFSDSFYWGIRIFPFSTSEIVSRLPALPSEFSHGWWPIISCSFTKGSLKGKSLSIPFLEIQIPGSGERPSNLKFTIIDNAKKSFRYWLERYISECFDIDHNAVLPYKNISWDITVYRYDCTMNVMYSKRLICVLPSFNASFLGENSHSADEIDLDFEILGEYR